MIIQDGVLCTLVGRFLSVHDTAACKTEEIFHFSFFISHFPLLLGRGLLGGIVKRSTAAGKLGG